MSTTPRLLCFAAGVTAFASLVAGHGAEPAAPEIELKAVKYADLKAAVRAQRGKVVVVDIWGVF